MRNLYTTKKKISVLLNALNSTQLIRFLSCQKSYRFVRKGYRFFPVQIIAAVSLPDFDPNERKEIVDLNFINRATKGVYEFGSVFKTFTLAAALQEKILNIDTQFENLEKKIWCAGNPIGEYDDKIPTDLTAEQIFVRSGNIGSVRIAQKVGPEKFKSFLEKIGVLSDIQFDIEEVAPQKNYNVFHLAIFFHL